MQTEENIPSRRSFHLTMIRLLGGLMGAVVAAPAAVYLLLKPKSAGEQDLVEIANLAEIPTGKPQEVVYYRTRVDGWKRVREKATAWVVKKSNNEAVAFHPACPHLGCAYHWESNENDEQGQAQEAFVCPCHASSFSKDGAVLGGPAPRPLDQYVAKVDGGKLLVSSEIKKVS
ncbi:MAG: hypothetical protein RL328_90 [Acidobacteriota bacterium]|jgi:Rieske Fe-S protein